MKALILIGLMTFSAFAASAQTIAAHVEDMHEYKLNEFELSGAEYWIHVQGKDFNYPDDVLWGFQGEQTNDGKVSSAPLPVRECALKAYNKLAQFLQNPPADFVDLKNHGATPRFFLWTNDFSQADPSDQERPNKFWHWNRGPKDYSKGYWKWESTLTHQSTCVIPEDAQIAEMIKQVRSELGL